MGLSNEQIKKKLSGQRSRPEIQRGIHHQDRLKFHSETVILKSDLGRAYREFTDWVGRQEPAILPKDKFSRFLQLLKTPIPTVELTEQIYSRLAKVFFSQDPFFNYEFTSPELSADWEDYRDKLFWQTSGLEAMKTAIDAVWVANIPIQTTSRPEPGNKLINIDRVVDIVNDADLNCIYVIYKEGEHFVVYDDERIAIFDKINIKPVFEIFHELGYTPARQFWSEKLESENLINKQSPVTKELSDLDWLLFHMTARKHMNLANSYQKEFYYEFDDDFKDPKRTEDKDAGPLEKKPLGHQMSGPGTIGTVPMPKGPDEFDGLKNPGVLLSPDVKTLKWHVDEENSLSTKIFRSVVGVDQNVLNDSAKNEKQIDSTFETQLSVLFRVKTNFEIINKFADSTLATIRYGDAFIGCEIDYGTKYFLKDVTTLHGDFKIAKEAGASEVILDDIYQKIVNTNYRSDNRSLARAQIIRELDPLPDRTDKEVINIFDKGGIDKINFVIKTNLLKFVQRFERSNGGLVEFGSAIDFDTKINEILNKFKQYADEINTSEPRPGDPD